MSIINRSSFGAFLWPGINAIYGNAYAEYPVEYTKLFETFQSSKYSEEDVGTVGLGLVAVKPEGQPVVYDAMQQGLKTRYAHVTYGSGFIITEEMIEDDQYMIVGSKNARALAYSIRQTKEILGANVYNRATSGSYLGGDGKSLMASDHPNVSGGTYQNMLTTAADFSEAALEQALIDIAAWTDDRGLKIAVRPKTLIVPPSLMFDVQRVLMSPLQAGNSNNDINALKSMGLVPEVTVNHYLTDADQWFLRTDIPDGMKYFERRGDSFDEDNDFDTNNLKYKATFRCSFGWTDPKAIYGSAGA